MAKIAKKGLKDRSNVAPPEQDVADVGKRKRSAEVRVGGVGARRAWRST